MVDPPRIEVTDGERRRCAGLLATLKDYRFVPDTKMRTCKVETLSIDMAALSIRVAERVFLHTNFSISWFLSDDAMLTEGT